MLWLIAPAVFLGVALALGWDREHGVLLMQPYDPVPTRPDAMARKRRRETRDALRAVSHILD